MDHIDIYLKTIGFSSFIFIVIILCLATPPKYTKQVLGWIAAITAAGALGFYGYGYGYACLNGNNVSVESVLPSILRTVFDSCRIFVGANNWDKIKDAYSRLRYPVLWETLFWVMHLLAMTTSASAVVTSLGSRLLKKIRLRLLRMRDITLIFGLSEDSLDFARKLAKVDKSAILFVDHSEQTKFSSAVDQMGALFRSDPDALSGNTQFLKSIGLKRGKRMLRVYALDKSMYANQQYARRLLAALEQQGILPEQTSLTILSVNEDTDHPMQAYTGHYGYGSLIFIQEPEMVARMLIRCYPPYRSLSFDKTGLSQTDFHGVIVGFGQIGQAVLRQLVMNSQFQGGSSRIAVFAPDYEKRMGWLSHECQAMLEQYNISLFPYDGRSVQFYDYLAANAGTINYIAICAGSDSANLEVGERFQPFLQRRGCNAPVLMCSHRAVSRLSAEDRIVPHSIYAPEILCTDRIDRLAMIINQQYKKQGDMLENWQKCNYFNRTSNRAAADFMDAILYCAGVSPAEASENWDPQGALLENLAATEHQRWNAFHYCMGFRLMTEEEFQKRAEEYLAEKAKNPDTDYRISKDVSQRIHGCLIPWEALDEYSRKEAAITGVDPHYAENDRDNVRGIGKLLQAEKKNP